MEQNWIAIDQGRISGVEYAGVIATNKNSAQEGIERALKLGIPLAIADRRQFKTGDIESRRKAQGELINRQIESFGGTVVMLNGTTIKIHDVVIEKFKGVLFNQHPGWPADTPNVRGLQPHEMMLEYVRRTGRNEGTRVTVHRVTSVVDGGTIVGYLDVPILEGDKAESLQKRALPSEYRLQETVLNGFVKGTLPAIPNINHFIRADEISLIPDVQAYSRAKYPEG